MNDCERLSDRMPDVALQRSEWTVEEAAHLTSCPECRAEWKLVVAASTLGEGAPRISDPSTLAATVQRRLGEHRARRTPTRRAWSLVGAAAAAAAILVAVTTGRNGDTELASPVVAQEEALVPLPELEGLETAQLDTLLNSIDGPLTETAGPDGSTLDASTLGEIEDGELEQVFAAWGEG